MGFFLEQQKATIHDWCKRSGATQLYTIYTKILQQKCRDILNVKTALFSFENMMHAYYVSLLVGLKKGYNTLKAQDTYVIKWAVIGFQKRSRV